MPMVEEQTHTAVLERCLEDLEARLAPAVEDELFERWRGFSQGHSEAAIFSPARPVANPARTEWPVVRINEALESFELMALQQYRNASCALEQRAGCLLCVRANYGTVILPSLFGVELFVMPEETNTLPGSKPLGFEGARRLLEKGMPELEASLGAKVLEMGRRYAEFAKRFPKVGRYVHVYHPDLQGPMDVLEMIVGSELFTALFDEPQTVHALLTLVTETYVAFLRRWQQLWPTRADGLAVHWGMLHRGVIMLRDDSAMNLSPAMYDTFIRPYNQRLLSEFGGGAIHFCGRGDHYIKVLTAMQGIAGVNLSQPQFNNMETIYRATLDQGIPLLGFSREAADAALHSGRDLHGRVHCW